MFVPPSVITVFTGDLPLPGQVEMQTHGFCSHAEVYYTLHAMRTKWYCLSYPFRIVPWEKEERRTGYCGAITGGVTPSEVSVPVPLSAESTTLARARNQAHGVWGLLSATCPFGTCCWRRPACEVGPSTTRAIRSRRQRGVEESEGRVMSHVVRSLQGKCPDSSTPPRDARWHAFKLPLVSPFELPATRILEHL